MEKVISKYDSNTGRSEVRTFQDSASGRFRVQLYTVGGDLMFDSGPCDNLAVAVDRLYDYCLNNLERV